MALFPWAKLSSRSSKKTDNLLALIPRRCLRHEIDEAGRITLLRPRFVNRTMQQWLERHSRKPCYRIRLDTLGSAVWAAIDGQKNVAQIGERIYEQLGEQCEPVNERLAAFLTRLHRSKIIEWVDN